MSARFQNGVFCSRDGIRPVGGLICDACKRIYARDEHGDFPTVQPVCSCGARFTPSNGSDFSARVVCDMCVKRSAA